MSRFPRSLNEALSQGELSAGRRSIRNPPSGPAGPWPTGRRGSIAWKNRVSNTTGLFPRSRVPGAARAVIVAMLKTIAEPLPLRNGQTAEVSAPALARSEPWRPLSPTPNLPFGPTTWERSGGRPTCSPGPDAYLGAISSADTRSRLSTPPSGDRTASGADETSSAVLHARGVLAAVSKSSGGLSASDVPRLGKKAEPVSATVRAMRAGDAASAPPALLAEASGAWQGGSAWV